ncbi:transmembrane protein 235 [Amia ocellicauda]|uniref:transmembrane protein 235 n=1 Tax=Amia ocellicauda TaxID=2972642 RepID=UPI0034645A9B
MNFGAVVVLAGLTGLLSFSLLAAALGSEHWYLVEVRGENGTRAEELGSHSGLWRTCEGKNACFPLNNPFDADTSNFSDPIRHLTTLHKVIVILLPLSLVLLVFGGICGLVSSLARSCPLLLGSGSYILLCSFLTLAGLSIYINYSRLALEEMVDMVGEERMASVHVAFGWSMGVAWLSFILEVITGFLLLFGARLTKLHHQSVPAISLT